MILAKQIMANMQDCIGYKYLCTIKMITDCCLSITQLMSVAIFLFSSGSVMFNSRFESRLKQHSLAKSRSESRDISCQKILGRFLFYEAFR